MKPAFALLAAGGTGGHLFPAEALAHVLRARGCKVALATDKRTQKFVGDFPSEAIYSIRSASPRKGGVAAKVGAAGALAQGIVSSWLLLRQIKPDVVVGFGGYPSVPPLLAATMLGVPTLLHEQNAVMGKANAFLARRATRVATGFPLMNAAPKIAAKAVVTGNPLRPSVIDAARKPFPNAQGHLGVLVVGGSQGARVMAEVLPPALAMLAPDRRARIKLAQQARGEDLEKVAQAYRHMGFEAELAPFFKDLPARIADSQLIIARSGASTVSELAVIGRPSVLVPYPFALDADQAANARELASSGGAEVIEQKDFTPDRLAKILEEALADPQGLARRAAAAKTVGVVNAAEKLADEAIRLADWK